MPRSTSDYAPSWPARLAAAGSPLLCAGQHAGHGAVRVAIAGELDIATAPQLERALRQAQADAELVIVDLRELDFIDSSGVHVLLAAERRVSQTGGRMVVVRGPAEVKRLFGLIGIDGELELVDRPPAPAGLEGVAA